MSKVNKLIAGHLMGVIKHSMPGEVRARVPQLIDMEGKPVQSEVFIGVQELTKSVRPYLTVQLQLKGGTESSELKFEPLSDKENKEGLFYLHFEYKDTGVLVPDDDLYGKGAIGPVVVLREAGDLKEKDSIPLELNTSMFGSVSRGKDRILWHRLLTNSKSNRFLESAEEFYSTSRFVLEKYG